MKTIEETKNAVNTMINYLGKAKHLTEDILKGVALNSCEIYGAEASRQIYSDKAVRRNIKVQMKDLIVRRSEEEVVHPDLINHWVRNDGDGTTWVLVWVIKGDEENAVNVLDELLVPWEGYGINSSYDCTGQVFRHEANFNQISDRVFVTQRVALDV